MSNLIPHTRTTKSTKVIIRDYRINRRVYDKSASCFLLPEVYGDVSNLAQSTSAVISGRVYGEHPAKITVMVSRYSRHKYKELVEENE